MRYEQFGGESFNFYLTDLKFRKSVLEKIILNDEVVHVTELVERVTIVGLGSRMGGTQVLENRNFR
jgi:hypothetical protein